MDNTAHYIKQLAGEKTEEQPGVKMSHKLNTNLLLEDSEILNIQTINTGGNIYNDVITLKNKQVVVITSDAVYLFKSFKDYDNNSLDYKTIYRQS